MKRICVFDKTLYWIFSEVDWRTAVEENRPNYEFDISGLREECEETTGTYDGEGIYKVEYHIWNSSKHGVNIEKINKEDLYKLALDMQDFLKLQIMHV